MQLSDDDEQQRKNNTLAIWIGFVGLLTIVALWALN